MVKPECEYLDQYALFSKMLTAVYQQIIVVTRSNLGVYDLNHSRLIEQIAFDGLSLAVPSEGPVDPDNDIVAHSLRVYKGKLFLLVRVLILYAH